MNEDTAVAEVETSGTQGAETDSGGLDINAASDSISRDLFGAPEAENVIEGEAEEVADTEEAAATTETTETEQAKSTESEESTEEVVSTRSIEVPPPSWSKDTQALWATIPPAARQQILNREEQALRGIETYKQDAQFGKPLKAVIEPFMPLIQARGIDPAKAVNALLNAQAHLDRDPKAGIMQIAKSYGVNLAELVESQGQEPQLDPNTKALQERLARIEENMTAAQQAELSRAREKTAAEVQAFASDPKHPYFDDVADDIVKLIKGGDTLEAAYEKAVWANPVTRAKEITRVQKEQEQTRREKLQKEAEAAKKAKAANVRNRDTRRAPTEPLGKMEDTMKQTLAEIMARTH